MLPDCSPQAKWVGKNYVVTLVQYTHRTRMGHRDYTLLGDDGGYIVLPGLRKLYCAVAIYDDYIMPKQQRISIQIFIFVVYI